MKFHSSLRRTLFALALPLVSVATLSAQTAAPSATTIPASKPATETATPSPGAPVNTSTPAAKTTPLRKAIADKYDKNHDGKLDADERAAMKADRGSRKTERLQKYDKNHDGKLDEGEKSAMQADRKAEAKASPTP